MFTVLIYAQPKSKNFTIIIKKKRVNDIYNDDCKLIFSNQTSQNYIKKADGEKGFRHCVCQTNLRLFAFNCLISVIKWTGEFRFFIYPGSDPRSSQS